MDSIDNNLIGVDHTYTVNAYVLRDKLMNLYPKQQINNCLLKLGYMNIDVISETKIFLIDELCKRIKLELNDNWDSNIKNKSTNELVEEIKNTENYKIFIDKMNYRIGRSFVLSKFINTIDTKKFYESLTLEELCILGY